MNYLLDTNVVSELIRAKPDKNVVAWFKLIPDENLYLSVLTLGEIRKGIEQIEIKVKKEKLRIWLEHDLPNWFDNRILSIDKDIADYWGRLHVQMKKRVLPATDSLLAATALHLDLALVTRNIADFNYPALTVINPWDTI
jgi:predicted nucleic acid-binding protein